MLNPYNPVASPRAYDLFEENRDEIERIGAGIPIGQTGQVTGTDGRAHAPNAGYDGEGVYAWSCVCGDGRSDYDGKDTATLAAGEHLLEVGAMVEAVTS